jgi:Tfp pilus assembly protein PilF/TolB-like protein
MWRYRVRVTVLAAVLVACAGSLVFSQPQAEAGSARPAAETPRPRVVLTFPFENTGQEASIEWLSEGLAELTIERLNGQGYYLLSRQQRLDALERAGLPVSTRFSRATMLKLGEEADADEVIFGQYSSDGTMLTITGRVLHLSPPSLSPEFSQSGLLSDLMSIHARLAGQLFCALTPAGPDGDDCGSSSPEILAFAAKLSAVAPAAFEAYIRGVTDSKEDVRLRHLRQAARLEPKWDAPALAIGDTYFARRNCEMALPWLTRVPGASRSGISAGFEAGVCYLLKNDPAKAQASFSDLLSRVGPQQLPEARSNLGVALARDGNFAEALAAFEQATRVDPEEPAYWVNLGLVHLRAQDPAAAVGPLRRALSFQPNDLEARTLLAVALEQSGREEEAQSERATLQQASRRILMPRNPTATDLTRFDRIRMRPDPGALRPAPLGQTESTDASDNMRGRQRIALHLQRGRQFLESGNLDDAQRAFIEALLLAPLDADAHTGLAEVYDRQGRPNDGVREYRAALASHDDVETRVALAGLLLRQDRLAEARAELQRVLDRDPNNVTAQDLFDQLRSRSGSGGSP